MARMIATALLALAMLGAMPARAESPRPPSVPVVDSPQLAALGPHQIGFRSITLVHKAQPDFAAADPRAQAVPLHDRKLVVDLWYPASPARRP